MPSTRQSGEQRPARFVWATASMPCALCPLPPPASFPSPPPPLPHSAPTPPPFRPHPAPTPPTLRSRSTPCSQKEYEEEKKRRDEEEAKRDPWEEEKAICEQLISWVGRYLPKKVEEEKKEDAPIDVPKGAKLHRGKGTNDGEEEDPYAGLIKKKSKRKGGKDAAAPEKPKAMKIALGPEDFAIFEKLGFKAPSTTEDCPKLYDELLEKKEWLKTAPPKKKKPPPAPPPAAEAPAEEAPAPAEGEFDLAAHEKAELEKKQADAAKKAKEKDELEKMNAEKDAALAAAGKRAAGGLHKFDPDEVDVHGGAATADDFMDAFGFGGDDMPAEEDDAAEAEAPAENGSADMISIQVFSSRGS